MTLRGQSAKSAPVILQIRSGLPCPRGYPPGMASRPCPQCGAQRRVRPSRRWGTTHELDCLECRNRRRAEQRAAPQPKPEKPKPQAHGHSFGPSLRCKRCGVPWKLHQRSPRRCGQE